MFNFYTNFRLISRPQADLNATDGVLQHLLLCGGLQYYYGALNGATHYEIALARMPLRKQDNMQRGPVLTTKHRAPLLFTARTIVPDYEDIIS